MDKRFEKVKKILYKAKPSADVIDLDITCLAQEICQLFETPVVNSSEPKPDGSASLTTVDKLIKEIKQHITQIGGKEVVILGDYIIYKKDGKEFAKAVWADWWQALKKQDGRREVVEELQAILNNNLPLESSIQALIDKLGR